MSIYCLDNHDSHEHGERARSVTWHLSNNRDRFVPPGELLTDVLFISQY